jgi:hypothetical protein
MTDILYEKYQNQIQTLDDENDHHYGDVGHNHDDDDNLQTCVLACGEQLTRYDQVRFFCL